jgi:hypothetical protein
VVASSNGLQRPGAPGAEQVSQAPVQALEQHSWPTQAPDAHSPLAAQAPPLEVSGWQIAAWQCVLESQR